MKNIKLEIGISLVALIITIIVLIILTGTVILLMNNGEIIGKSKEAVFKNDIMNFQEELRIKILDKQVESLGSFDKKNIYAAWNMYDDKDIKYWIKSYTEKYGDKFEIEKGKLVCVEEKLSEEEKIYLNELGFINSSIIVEKDDFKFSCDKEDNTACVISLSEQGKTRVENEVTSLSIPDSIMLENGQEYVITRIGDEAFSECVNLSLITLPNSIKTIGYCAFYGCLNIQTINLPSSILSIDTAAFAGCENLSSISLSNNISVIKNSTFAGCINLSSISLPNNLINIEERAFEGCMSLESVVLPNSIQIIGIGAFSACENLSSISLPDSLRTIEEAAFAGCVSLLSISLPDSITTIGEYVFADCISITSLIVPWNSQDSRNINAPWGLDGSVITYAE